MRANKNVRVCNVRKSTVFPTHCSLHSITHFSNFFQIEMNTIVITFLFFIINQTEFRWADNHTEKSHYDLISLNLKGVRKIYPWLYVPLIFDSAFSHQPIQNLLLNISVSIVQRNCCIIHIICISPSKPSQSLQFNRSQQQLHSLARSLA